MTNDNKTDIIITRNGMVFLLISAKKFSYILLEDRIIKLMSGGNTPFLSFKPYSSEKLLSYEFNNE